MTPLLILFLSFSIHPAGAQSPMHPFDRYYQTTIEAEVLRIALPAYILQNVPDFEPELKALQDRTPFPVGSLFSQVFAVELRKTLAEKFPDYLEERLPYLYPYRIERILHTKIKYPYDYQVDRPLAGKVAFSKCVKDVLMQLLERPEFAKLRESMSNITSQCLSRENVTLEEIADVISSSMTGSMAGEVRSGTTLFAIMEIFDQAYSSRKNQPEIAKAILQPRTKAIAASLQIYLNNYYQFRYSGLDDAFYNPMHLQVVIRPSDSTDLTNYNIALCQETPTHPRFVQIELPPLAAYQMESQYLRLQIAAKVSAALLKHRWKELHTPVDTHDNPELAQVIEVLVNQDQTFVSALMASIESSTPLETLVKKRAVEIQEVMGKLQSKDSPENKASLIKCQQELFGLCYFYQRYKHGGWKEVQAVLDAPQSVKVADFQEALQSTLQQ